MLNKYIKCNIWRLAVRYDIYIYIYVIRRLKVKCRYNLFSRAWWLYFQIFIPWILSVPFWCHNFFSLCLFLSRTANLYYITANIARAIGNVVYIFLSCSNVCIHTVLTLTFNRLKHCGDYEMTASTIKGVIILLTLCIYGFHIWFSK